MTGSDVQATTCAPDRSRRPSARDVGRLFLGCAVVGALLSLLVGWLWVVLSDPPQVPLARGGGIFLGEEALDQQSGVTMWFIVLGAGFGALAGLVVGWIGQRFGWLSVAAVLLLCGVATVVSATLGIHVFGPDLRSEAAGASVGDLIRVDMSLGSWVAYLGWPLGGLVGVLAAIAGWSRWPQASQDAGS